MYQLALRYKRSADRYKKLSNKKRITKAFKMSITEDFARANVNESTYRFIMSQLRNQKKAKRGRRYSLEDKILALSLLKQSPKAYRLLRKIFALPSRKTLMTLLNNLRCSTGINPQIMKALGESVTKMQVVDTYCALLFDEMAVEPGLSYDPKTDQIEGFQNCGEGQSAKFADHVMVFMLRGLHKKWKQPVAHFFTEYGMSAADLQRNIKDVISACQKIGLHVVATVCDQMSSNVKAITNLRKYSREKALRRGEEYRSVGFQINEEEVIPLFDPPHLIKGLRNNLLEHDVSFKWKDDVMKTGSWKDIRRLYELDEGDFDTKMLNHLTDAHIIPEKMKKMKVKIATQVLSRRVSSTLRCMARIGIYFSYGLLRNIRNTYGI